MPAAPWSVLEESGEASEKACVAGEEEGARQRCMLSAGDKRSWTIVAFIKREKKSAARFRKEGNKFNLGQTELKMPGGKKKKKKCLVAIL